MRILIGALLVLCSFSAVANPVSTDNRPAVQLEASALREVPEDTAHATLFVEKEHASAAMAQQLVSQVLSAALAKAKKDKDVSVKTGRTATYAVYGKDNRITAWRVRGELVLESKKVAELSQTVTAMTETMSIANMWFSLSTEAQRKVQEELQGEAVVAFKEKAETATRQFGFARYALSEARIAVSGQNVRFHEGVMQLSRAKSASANVPMEAGKTTVSVSVAGTIRLEK